MLRSMLRGRARSLLVIPALAALLALGAGSASAATPGPNMGSGTYHLVPSSQVFVGCLFVGNYGTSNLYYCA